MSTFKIVSFIDENGREIILPDPTCICLHCNSINLTDSNAVGAKLCNGCGLIPPFVTACFCCKKAFLSSFTGLSPAEAAKLTAEEIFCSVVCLEYHTAKKRDEEEAEKAARLREIELEQRARMLHELRERMVALQEGTRQILDQGFMEEREMARKEESRKRLLEETPSEFAPDKAICSRSALGSEPLEIVSKETIVVDPAPIVQKPPPNAPRALRIEDNFAKFFPGFTRVRVGKSTGTRLASLFDETPLDSVMDRVHPLSAKSYNGSAFAFYISMEPMLLETQFIGPLPLLGNIYIYFLKMYVVSTQKYYEGISNLNADRQKLDFLDQLKEHLMPIEPRKKRKGRKSHDEDEEEEEEDEDEEEEDEKSEENDHVLGSIWPTGNTNEPVLDGPLGGDEATLEGFPGGVPLQKIFPDGEVLGTVHSMFDL